MKHRRQLAAVIMAAMLIGGTTILKAVEEENPGIVFTGDSQNYFSFNVDKNEFSNKFTGMIPGETRSKEFTLSNQDDRELRFYINASVLSDLTNDNISASGAVYTITLLRDGEEFYRGIIGGVEGTLKDLNSGNISQNQLIASLKKGESSRITMKIGIDGESMNNDYQNTVGQLRLEFNVEQGEVATPDDVVIKKENVIYVEKPVKKTTEKKKDKTILERISTGDTTAVGLLAVIVFISGAAGILIIKRKGVKQHEK